MPSPSRPALRIPVRLSALRPSVTLLFAPAVAFAAGPVPVSDGRFDEWDGRAPVHADPSGDAPSIDFGRLWAMSDAERVTLRLEIGTELNLQGHNAITIAIDGDNDAATGCARDGLGAELVWTFGERSGLHCHDGYATRIRQGDFDLRTAPTVSSTEFEISFRRARTDGTPLLPGPVVSLVIRGGNDETADRLPDAGVVTLTLSGEPPPTPPAPSLERSHPEDIRVLTWNVRFDGLFHRPAAFLRVLRAIDPDVVCFQEIWGHTSQQSADQVALALPESDWHAAAAVEGHIVSRYPFRSEASIDESGNYWAWIDLPDDRYDADLSIVNAHPPCCEKEQRRQNELDGIAAWVRDLVTPGGFEVPAGTPTVITGDMNLVGGAAQLRTIQAGRIADEAMYGPSFAPDWDGTALADADPRVANGFSNATWRNPDGEYSPGKLDYVLYSDSVLRLHNRFVLDTSRLPAALLERYGLRRDDTDIASDHFPVVADFTPVAAPGGTARDE